MVEEGGHVSKNEVDKANKRGGNEIIDKNDKEA